MLDSTAFRSIGTRRHGGENRYMVFDVTYASNFPRPQALRHALKIELNCTGLSLPPQTRRMGLLFAALAGTGARPHVEMACVHLSEAAVEKLVSFPRRIALHHRTVAAKADHGLDSTLVRHLYDVHEISRLRPDIVSDHPLLASLMLSVLEKDAKDFATQHPQFLDDPITEIRRAMSQVRESGEMRILYTHFLEAMVYGDRRPEFGAAFAVFQSTLETALLPHVGLNLRASASPSRIAGQVLPKGPSF